MKKKYRFTFGSDKEEVVDFLKEQQIEIDIGELISACEIYSDKENIAEIINFLETHNIRFWPSTSECIYTKQELDEAEWLKVKGTWYSGYPQPERDSEFINITYDSSNYCDKCYKGLVQKDSFRMKKKPSFGSRNFMMLNWVHDELFVSDRVEAIFKKNDVKGVDFYKVLSKSQKEMENTKQLYIENYIEPGFMSESVEKELICPKCSFMKYLTKLGFIYYNKNVFNDVNADIVKSHDKFGELTCCSIIIVSQRLRKIILDNNIGRGLIFEPLQLV